MHRFFIEADDQVREKDILLNHIETVKHLVKVLRVKLHESIELVDALYVYETQVVETSLDQVHVNILSKKSHDHETDHVIDLFQCLPKGPKLEWIVQKNVELGVAGIYLVASKRCVVEWKSSDVPKKLDRYVKIAKEAAKQSKRDVVPLVQGVETIETLTALIKNYDLFVVLYEHESKQGLKSLIQNKSGQKIGILIGPEGGFDEAEIERLIIAGASIATLGKRILRTETAGMVAVTCVQYENDALS